MEDSNKSEASTSIGSQSSETRGKRVVVGLSLRAIFASVLLIGEYLTISFFFDAQALIEVKSFGFILGNLGYVAPLIVLAAAATFAFQGPQLKSALAQITSQFESSRRVWPWIVLQLLLFSGFFVFTSSLYRTVETTDSPSVVWAIGWAIAAVCVLLSTIPIVSPIQAIGPLLRASSSSLLVGAFGGALAWLAGIASTQLWVQLGRYTVDLVVGFLAFFNTGVQVDRNELIVGIDPFFVHIAPICSGFEGIGLIVAFLGLYLFIFRRELRFPKVLIIIPVAAVLVWGLNVVRIAALIAIGRWISPEVALGGFHSKAGWVFFCAVSLATIVVIRGSDFFSKKSVKEETAASCDVETVNPTAALLVPLLAVIFTSLVTGLFSAPGFDALYPLRVIVAAIGLWFYRDYYRPIAWSFSWDGPALGIVVFAIWISIVDSGDGSALREGLFALPTWAVILWVAFRVVGTSVTVPIVEELAFRSYLLRRLMSNDFEQVPKKRFGWIAFLVSSLAFGALHQQYVAGTIAGMFYAYAQYRRGRTGDAIIAHAVTNALIAIYVLARGQWSLW